MLYLAKIYKYQLRLLARQESENLWVVMSETTLIPLEKETTMSEKVLVLVQLSPTGKIESLEDASSWVLNLVQTYLTTGVTPEQLQKEAERAESWRQSLTLQNQELARRSLELEARREQIQALEESLKRHKNNSQKNSD
ncbi:hypothetical protein VB620_07485 [Nodularia harveyana UHCC-0300]|uniref:Uncharacterized protein n=1 Tax=Nodularia harveyana UHCC-0300 TaxID=2974287 RepID=A0ABU5UCC0_9CYAN|nr:hypothetical protein [Nodularia harveyana]MEA5581179.1 hypothetical protein [Nodularia harveyana UHCC-0300]